MQSQTFKNTFDEVRSELKKTLDFDRSSVTHQENLPSLSEVKCFECSTAMITILENKYETVWGIAILLFGILASLFFVGIIIGIPLIIFGIYMLISKSAVHKCPKCGTSIIMRKHHE